MRIEVDQEDDGRWIAEIPELAGVMVYGSPDQTDDSEMAMLLARVLADQGGYDPEKARKACIFWLGPDRIYSHP